MLYEAKWGGTQTNHFDDAVKNWESLESLWGALLNQIFTFVFTGRNYPFKS